MDSLFESYALSKRYGKKTVLNNVSLSLESGKIYGLVGLNGAGKTTLMRVMAGLVRPNSGTIELFGESGAKGLERARRKIGFLIENPIFFATMTAKQNLKAVQMLKNSKSDDLDGLLKELGIFSEKRTMLNNFSTGMKQRYGLAAALIGNPELLVLDEPINGLDVKGVQEFRALINGLVEKRGVTLLISSHILSELHNLATDFIFLHEGKVVEQLTHGELTRKCNRFTVIKTSDNAVAFQTLSRLTNELELKEDCIHINSQELSNEEIAQRMKSNGVMIYGLEQKGVGLEDYFTSLIGGASRV